MGRPGAVALETQWLVGLPGVGRPGAEKPMSEAKTSAAESSRAVVLTAASLIAAIMIERPFDTYPDRWIESLFVGMAMALGAACFLRFTATPHPAVLNSLILRAAAQDAVIVVLQLRWWSRTTRAA